MKTHLAVTITSLMGFNALADLPPKFVRAIHMVESSGRYGKIDGDYVNGKPRAKGPMQLHFSYWKDAIQYNPSIGGRYEDCYDFNYSVKIMNAYMERYGMKYIKTNNLEALSRLHNGGLGGINSSITNGYWNKVKKYL